MSAPLKGERKDLQVTSSEQAAASPSLSTSPLADTTVEHNTMHSNAETPIPAHTDQLNQHTEPLTLCCSTWIHKPSHIMHDLQSGEGVTSILGIMPYQSPGLQTLGSSIEEPEKAGGVWAVIDGAPTLLKVFDGFEHMFMAQTADAKALEPQMLTKAKCQPDWLLWEKAIQEELVMLKAAGTWRLEEAPAHTNVISSKWVFKAKKDTVGNITWYKACLVAQGFSQIRGIDYNDTYTPVAHLASSHAIITMVNYLSLELHQVDIKGAYLNGMLNKGKVLYMQHAPGYKSHDAGNCILCLVKTLYGLKQSG